MLFSHFILPGLIFFVSWRHIIVGDRLKIMWSNEGSFDEMPFALQPTTFKLLSTKNFLFMPLLVLCFLALAFKNPFLWHCSTDSDTDLLAVGLKKETPLWWILIVWNFLVYCLALWHLIDTIFDLHIGEVGWCVKKYIGYLH